MQSEVAERAERFAERFEPFEDADPADITEGAVHPGHARRAATARFDEVINEHRDYYELRDAELAVLMLNKDDELIHDRWPLAAIELVESTDASGIYELDGRTIGLSESQLTTSEDGSLWFTVYALKVVTDDD